jgi:uncharacterized UPF0160 family protein
MEANSYSTNKPVNQVTSGVESAKISRVITHSGPFHCDDVFAVACFKLLDPGIEVVRTRDQIALAAGSIDPSTVLVDVGGEFNPDNGVFDHHFVGAPVRSNGTPYASFGMVAEHLYPHQLEKSEGFYQLVTAVDSSDNGIKQEGWSLSKSVHKCNPVIGQDFDGRFKSLVEIARQIIQGVFEQEYTLDYAVARFESHALVIEWVEEHDAALAASSARVRAAFEQEGPLLLFDRYEPALMDTADEAPIDKLFSVYPSPSGEWMVQQIPASKGSFEGRKKLPAHWAGKRGEDLDALSLVEGCVFCHPGRFIAGNKTREGAVEMAKLAVFFSSLSSSNEHVPSSGQACA